MNLRILGISYKENQTVFVQCILECIFTVNLIYILGFPGGLAVKNPPAMQETWVQSLGGVDPLEEGMATHSSILAWEISWTEDPMELERV